MRDHQCTGLGNDATCSHNAVRCDDDLVDAGHDSEDSRVGNQARLDALLGKLLSCLMACKLGSCFANNHLEVSGLFGFDKEACES